MLAALRSLPANDVTPSHIEEQSNIITELDHASHAAKSPWARLKSLEQRKNKSKAQVAKAEGDRDAASLRREAAMREHAHAEQAYYDAVHALAGIEEEWDKVQSEVDAEEQDAAGPGADMEAESRPARTDLSSWSFADLERAAP